MDLKDLFDQTTLLRWAGGKSYERGASYRAEGRVRDLEQHDGTATARVQGERIYAVRLWSKQDEFCFSCTCPVGEQGEFCKHGVAVALTLLDGEPDGGSRTLPSPAAAGPLIKIRAYLAGLPQAELAEILALRAIEDAALRRKLLLRAASARAEGPDLVAIRKAITSAFAARGFVEYHRMDSFVEEALHVVDTLEALARGDLAVEAIGLAEHALAAAERAMDFVDDSDGRMRELFERLHELHLAACDRVRPDPEALAHRLFAWELRSDWDVFSGAAARYAKVLGKRGLAAYRELAEAEWAKVPERKPGEAGSEQFDPDRFRITQIMVSLARASGDVEAVVAVMRRDLSSSHDFARIVEVYRKARHRELAVEWAERGLKAFPVRTDSDLRAFLVEEYRRRGRHDEALALLWAEYVERVALPDLAPLKKYAERQRAWPEWRERVLAHLRSLRGPLGRSDLVRYFLWEGDDDEALREARAGGCTQELWLEVAAAREERHPADAVEALHRLIEPTLAGRNKDAYRRAVGYLERIRGLMKRMGKEEEFQRLLAGVRTAHKQKRNLAALLDARRWV